MAFLNMLSKSSVKFNTSSDSEISNIMFADLDLPDFDHKMFASCLKKIPETQWQMNDLRGTKGLALMTSTGKAKDFKLQCDRDAREYKWTEHAADCIVEYFESNIWPWVGRGTRVTVLRTLPHQSINLHVDCSPEKINTLQLKLRMVVQGQTDTLFFLDRNGEKIFAPKTKKPYIIDGTWPHGVLNQNETKYTICVGSPWTGSEYYPKFNRRYLKSEYLLPNLDSAYFDPTYQQNLPDSKL
jgi:hypothetical protein